MKLASNAESLAPIMSQTTCTSRGRALSLFATAFLLFTTTAMASEAGASGEGGGPFE